MARNVPDYTAIENIARGGSLGVSSYVRPSIDDFDTWMNRSAGGANASVVDYSGGPIIMSADDVSGSDKRTMLLKNPPATTPWVVEAYFDTFGFNDSTSLIGLFGAQSVTGGKLVLMHAQSNGAIFMDNYANSNLSTAGSSGITSDSNRYRPDMPLFVRMKHTGDGLEFSFSQDGFDWFIKNTDPAQALAYLTDGVGKIGFGFVVSGSTTRGKIVLYKWVEWIET